jgi:hypothetical protein
MLSSTKWRVMFSPGHRSVVGGKVAPTQPGRESEGGTREGRLQGARGVGSPTGGWKPPLLQPTADSVNSGRYLPGPREE